MRTLTESIPPSNRCNRCDRNLASSIWNDQNIALKTTPKRNFTKFICIQCVISLMKRKDKDVEINKNFFHNLIDKPIPTNLIGQV